MENFEEIEKAKIPDEDMPEWIKSLRKGGLDDEEIDSVLKNLNLTYKKVKEPNFIEKELVEIKKYYKNKYNRILTAEEIEYFKEGIENE